MQFPPHPFKMIQDILKAILGNKWLYALVLTILFYLGAKLLAWILRVVVHAFVKKTKTNLDDLILEKTKIWVVGLFFFIALRIWVIPILDGDLLSKINNSIIVFLVSMIVIIIAGISINVWGKIWAKRTKSTLDDNLLPLFRKLSNVIFGIAGLLSILKIWSIDITPFLAGAGVAGLVLGLALKDTLANIFGGISLILDKNFQIDDTIKLSSGEIGKIMDIGLRSTKISTFDNELLVIPNANLANATIQNFAKPEPKARVVVEFGVVYGSDVEKVRKTVLNAVKKIKEISDDPAPRVYFNAMNDFSLGFRLYFWVDSYTKRFDAKEEATELIYNALNKAKIEIPFPTHTVYLKK